jgi:hypothetical protein
MRLLVNQTKAPYSQPKSTGCASSDGCGVGSFNGLTRPSIWKFDIAEDMDSLHHRIEALLNATPDPERDYYALSIFLGDKCLPEYACFSGWVGYTDETPKREIREASIVHADRILVAWRRMDEPGMVVNTGDEFALYFSFGGHAVVERELAEFAIPEWLAPIVTVHEGQWGFASPHVLPSTAMQRAPSPKLRMKIIKRDEYKCRVCGRSPKNHVDIELHVHHIRPWAAGGVTEDKNLITLCHTCHNGLDPHFEYSLFKLIAPDPDSDRSTAYQKRLAAYQEAAAAASRRSDV